MMAQYAWQTPAGTAAMRTRLQGQGMSSQWLDSQQGQNYIGASLNRPTDPFADQGGWGSMSQPKAQYNADGMDASGHYDPVMDTNLMAQGQAAARAHPSASTLALPQVNTASFGTYTNDPAATGYLQSHGFFSGGSSGLGLPSSPVDNMKQVLQSAVANYGPNPWQKGSDWYNAQQGNIVGTAAQQFGNARDNAARQYALQGISPASGIQAETDRAARLGAARQSAGGLQNLAIQSAQNSQDWENQRRQFLLQAQDAINRGDQQGFNDAIQRAQLQHQMQQDALFDPLRAEGLRLGNVSADLGNQKAGLALPYVAPMLQADLTGRGISNQSAGLSLQEQQDTSAGRVGAANAGYTADTANSQLQTTNANAGRQMLDRLLSDPSFMNGLTYLQKSKLQELEKQAALQPGKDILNDIMSTLGNFGAIGGKVISAVGGLGL